MNLELRKKRARVVLKELKRLYPTLQPFLHSNNDFEFLVAVILSAQCTDKKVNEVTEKLFQKYKKREDYVNAKLENFEKDINQIGLYKSKAKNILACAKMIQEQFHGKIPNTMEKMILLPGVGRKTANVVLGNIYGVVEGIAVDTHVARLSEKFSLSDHKDREKIEKDLMHILPKKEWFLFTNRMIAYGREYSPAHKKKSLEDPISQALLQKNFTK